MNSITSNSGLTADKTISVQDFIAMSGSDDITYYNYSVLENLNGYDMFITNLLYDYESEIRDIAKTVQFTEQEKAKYRYKPYLLAYDVYGSTETKFIIMMLNGIIDPKEFTFSKVKLIAKSDLSTILNRIESVEEEYKGKLKSRLKAEKLENDGNDIWTE